MTHMIVARTLRLFALTFGTLTLLTATALGQSPAWRNDYQAARAEATEKNRPLVVDVVTEHCSWCKKLDAGPFRDPAIIALINDRFVPLKIDANREADLAAKLQIRSYPTIIIATNDGRILSFVEGYVDGPKLVEHLNKALPPKSGPGPDWMARDFQDAEKAIAAGDSARAVALLKLICEDYRDFSVQANARKALRELEKQAEGRLVYARKVDEQGQSLEAIDTLGDLMRAYPGTTAANEAKGLLMALAAKPEVRERQRSRRARELMAQARDEFRVQQFHECLERCDLIAASFPDLPEALEASKIASEIKSNPEWLAKASRGLENRLGAMYLALADSWVKQGKYDEATASLTKVQQLFPNTLNAQLAQLKLAQIQGLPNQRTDFKRSP